MLAFRWSEREQARPTRTALRSDSGRNCRPASTPCCRCSAPPRSCSTRATPSSRPARPRTRSGWCAAAGSPSTRCCRWPVRPGGTARYGRSSWTCRAAAPAAVRRLAVSARVAPLGSRLVLLLVEDLTEARRIEAVRRDFVANVSHELKTPVGALSLLSEAVMDASRRPRGGPPVRRPHADRGDPADQPGPGDHRPLQGAGRRPAGGRRAGRGRRPGRRGDRPLPPPGQRQADHHGHRYRPPSCRLGQPGPARRRPRQPRRERRQLQPGPHPGRDRRAPGPRGRRGPDRDLRHRPGHRHLREGPRAHLRALLPRGPGPLPRHRRHRPRPVHRQARGRLARRGGHRVERRGTGLHLHPAAPRGRARPDRAPAARYRPRRRRRTRNAADSTVGRPALSTTSPNHFPAPEALP